MSQGRDSKKHRRSERAMNPQWGSRMNRQLDSTMNRLLDLTTFARPGSTVILWRVPVNQRSSRR